MATANFYEIRTANTKGNALAADLIRHLHARQFLGRTLVICANPHSLLSACRKQWLRITRAVQTQRASTLNAEEVLRLTHAVIRMQLMVFAAHEPQEEQEGHVYFLTPDQIGIVPSDCLTVYLAAPITAQQLEHLRTETPENSLFVNYEAGLSLSSLGLRPKSELETSVLRQWQELSAYLKDRGIIAEHLIGTPDQLEEANEALDTLLTSSNDFLRKAAAFRLALDLAQPLSTISADYVRLFDAVTRLAHRVQTLRPGNFSAYMFKSFGAESSGQDSFFLRDVEASGYYPFMEQETPNSGLPAHGQFYAPITSLAPSPAKHSKLNQ